MGLEFNPKVTTNEQLLKQKDNLTITSDSTRTSNVDVHTAAKQERAKQTQNTTNVEVKQTQTRTQTRTQTQKPTQAKTTGSGKKPAQPPKPVELEITVTSTNSSQPIIGPDGEVSGKTLVGSFDTNIPTFEGLNDKNMPAVAEVSGIGIYSKGSKRAPIVRHVEGPPAYDEVSFSLGYKVKIPQQDEPVKGSIVYNSATKTYAFNNIEGIEIDAAPMKGNGVYGGEQILITGGSVKKINTQEQWNYLGKDRNNNDMRPQEQIIVLKDTTVENGALTISQDKVIALGETQIDANKINVRKSDNVVGTSTTSNWYSSSYFASDNIEATVRGELQSGITTRQALTNWLGGNKEDVEKLTTQEGEKQGTLKVEDERFDGANMENVSVARKIGNLNIYSTDGDGTKITIKEGKVTKGKIRLYLNGVNIEISADQAKDAKIFVDRKTKTIVMENIKGLEINPDNKTLYGARIQTNLLLKDCQVDFISTADRYRSDNISNLASKNTQEKFKSNIGLVGNTTVTTLITDGADKVLIDNSENATVEVTDFWGFGTQTNSSDLDGQNHAWVNGTRIGSRDNKYIPKELGGMPYQISYTDN